MPHGKPHFPAGWENTDLCRLAAAARKCVRDNTLDGPLALSYVLWETPAMTAALLAAPLEEARPPRLDAGAHEWLAEWDRRKRKAA